MLRHCCNRRIAHWHVSNDTIFPAKIANKIELHAAETRFFHRLFNVALKVKIFHYPFAFASKNDYLCRREDRNVVFPFLLLLPRRHPICVKSVFMEKQNHAEQFLLSCFLIIFQNLFCCFPISNYSPVSLYPSRNLQGLKDCLKTNHTPTPCIPPSLHKSKKQYKA